MIKNLLILFICTTIVVPVKCQISRSKITGSGKIVSITKKIDYFNKIVNYGSLTIYISQSDTCSIKIETDDNIVNLLDVSVSDECLFISALSNKYIVNYLTKLNLYISLNQLKSLTNKGTGNISISKFSGINDFEFINTGTGSVDMEINGSLIKILNGGIGNFSFSGEAKKISFINSATGSVFLSKVISDSLIINTKGTGRIEIDGKAKVCNILNSGVGDISAFNLTVDFLDIVNNGIGEGHIDLCFIKELSIVSNSEGTIQYKGDGLIKKIERNKGLIKKVENTY